MFSREKSIEEEREYRSSPGGASTVIARGVKVEGDFNSEGDVVIEGEVKGTLSTTGSLTVGSDAMIRADVKAGTANISGTVEGNVTAETDVILSSSARIKGDIFAATINVERGAKIEGHLSVGEKPSSAPVTSPTAKTIAAGKATKNEKNGEIKTEDEENG